MKRLATVLFLTALIVSSIFSRSSGDKYVGLSAGYVYSTINTETGYKTGQSYLPGNGFSISVPVVIQVHDNIGVETGIDFIQKRFTSRYLSQFPSLMQTKHMNATPTTTWSFPLP